MKRKQFLTSEDARPFAKQHRAPCSDCPWSRKSIPGWIGPNSIDAWVACAHSDQPIHCHTRNQLHGEPWQCAGAAIYRANVCKSSKYGNLELLKNTKLVFSWKEFETHHASGLFGKARK